jgi:hypothetical protein
MAIAPVVCFTARKKTLETKELKHMPHETTPVRSIFSVQDGGTVIPQHIFLILVSENLLVVLALLWKKKKKKLWSLRLLPCWPHIYPFQWWSTHTTVEQHVPPSAVSTTTLHRALCSHSAVGKCQNRN